MGRKPREWKEPESSAGDVEPEVSASMLVRPVFGGVVSPAPEADLSGYLTPDQIPGAFVPAPDVINTVKADEPIPSVEILPEWNAEERAALEAAAGAVSGVAQMLSDPAYSVDGTGTVTKIDEGDPEWIGSPCISIRASLAVALANPGPWPNAERLGRAQRHMEELINALPEAIEAARSFASMSDLRGCLEEDLETLRDILA